MPSTFDRFVEANSYGKKTFDLSVAANIGVDINIWKRKIYCTVGGGYEFGIMNCFVSDGTQYYGNGSFPFAVKLSNDHTKIEEHVAVHSMISGLSLSRRGIWFTTGLKFKL